MWQMATNTGWGQEEVLSGMAGEGLSRKGAWEQRYKGGEEVSHEDLWGARAPDSGDRVSQGTEARAKAVCPRNRERPAWLE